MEEKAGIPFLSTHLQMTPCTFAFPFSVYSARRTSKSDIFTITQEAYYWTTSLLFYEKLKVLPIAFGVGK